MTTPLRRVARRGIVAARMTGGQGAAMAGDAGDEGRERGAGVRPAPKLRDARAERLAAQLKANLKRRKEQARGRAAGEDEAG
ncbi:MAG: hypothetical protein ACT6XY_19710 [Phreatobacter sp.]|uniref:hypothetical protein n=1 Tax=Phreatobacter sp. TaxID=1966341 RepID=UPI004036736E